MAFVGRHGTGILGARFAECELTAANHDRDQTGDLRNSVCVQRLQSREAGVERRLWKRNRREEDHKVTRLRFERIRRRILSTGVCNRRSGVGIMGTSSGPGRAAICPNRRRKSRSLSNKFLIVEVRSKASYGSNHVRKSMATLKRAIPWPPSAIICRGDRPASTSKPRSHAHWSVAEESPAGFDQAGCIPSVARVQMVGNQVKQACSSAN